MQLKDMFLKDIRREITGVIKVGQTDEEIIKQELEEYVVTREIRERLYTFYNNYAKSIDGTTDKMGVWISGFFGSGKSHLLKILSYLLSNKQVKGKKAIDYFEDKIEDPLLFAEMKRIANVKTETILFNIESKNPINNKNKEDAILRIFVNVFNEHRNLCSEIPGVAAMESQLIKENLYEKFKEEFLKLRGKPWEDRRNAIYFDKEYVAKALANVFDISIDDAKEYINNKVLNYEITIEKFAKEVKEYVDSKGDNFHLIFLVDEIGQYIGDNTSLMLNLQTVVEDLGRYCMGKVWVIVTSQEEIDRYTKVQGNDFSKIQGRFDTRLSLSSISVDEVIKKRLLEKNENAKLLLKVLYEEKNVILKNLITFKEAKSDLLGYEDENEFVDVYPFIPYQFKILQRVFDEVRKHGNSGKHLSRGERSMISAFREAAIKFADKEEGVLIPFWAFYDTIEEFLSPAISGVVRRAMDNPALKDDPINIQLLKVLFLIKYLDDEIPSNLENITTLMVSSIDEDKLSLKEHIREALNRLESENLIQKNGDRYIFLTDDEQDVNREIRAEEVDEDLLKKELSSYIFEDIYDDNKYRYSNIYQFPFNKKMDEKERGSQQYSIGINILSPLSSNYYKDDTELRMMSQDSKEVLVKLGGNSEYIDELTEALKIDSYIKKKNINLLPENIQEIITSKQREANVRRKRAQELLRDAIMQGTFYILGQKVDLKGSSPKEKINAAFEILVNNVYNKLGYIQKNIRDENEILEILTGDSQQLAFSSSNTNDNELAEKEVLDFIDMQDLYHQQLTMKGLLNQFTSAPYGWTNYDIAGIVAKLFRKQEIKLRINGEYLDLSDPAKIVKSLTRQSEVEKLVINRRRKIDADVIKRVKNICLELFGSIDLPDDEDKLVEHIKNMLDKEIKKINSYMEKYKVNSKYPGKSVFEQGLEMLNEFLIEKDNLALFGKLIDKENELLQWKDEVEKPIFFFDKQVEIFDKGLQIYSKCEKNKIYLNQEIKEQMDKLKEILDSPSPYKEIKAIPTIVQKIENAFNEIVRTQKESVKRQIREDFDTILTKANQYGLFEVSKKINDFYNNLLSIIEKSKDLEQIYAVLGQSSAKKKDFENEIESEYFKQNQKIDNDSTPVSTEVSVFNVDKTTQTIKIKVSNLTGKKIVKSKEDIESFINELKNKLIEMLNNHEAIEIE
ncbi:MAG: BREX system P-loop protein BrxC [Candidatus Micrarchaeota archaeon]|nr:BREX system P-loop protein BrxC [Candidatus Micrarchaeota archaeon]